MAFDLREK